MIKETDKPKFNNEYASYIWDLFNYMYPDEEIPNNGWWEFVFPKRYNNDEINFPRTYKDYLKNRYLQGFINVFGLDVEKFWYFILFIYDISYTKSINFIPLAESPANQFKKFVSEIDKVLELDENGVIARDKFNKIKFDDDVSIELRINKKKKAVIDNKVAVYWLGVIMEEFFDRIENAEHIQELINDEENDDKRKELIENRDYRLCNTRILGENMFKRDKFDASKHYRNYLIIYYLKEFFELNKDKKKKAKNKDGYSSKDLFITELLKFINLFDYLVGEKDYIKNTFKHYQNIDVKGFSFSSFEYK